MSKQPSDYKGLVILSAFLTPILGGAIIYYSLRNSHEALAKLANITSFLAFVIWIAVAMIGINVTGPVSLLTLVAGIVLAVITVGNVKKTSSS